jgi:hypothetical protein
MYPYGPRIELFARRKIMPKVIKASGIEVSRNDKGELSLRVNFRDFDTEQEEKYSWMPQWETLRNLMFSAVTVEAMNTGDSKELDRFDGCLRLCRMIRQVLTDMLKGRMGIESK